MAFSLSPYHSLLGENQRTAQESSSRVPSHKHMAVMQRPWATRGQRGLGGARKIWGRESTKWVNLGKDGVEKWSFQMGAGAARVGQEHAGAVQGAGEPSDQVCPPGGSDLGPPASPHPHCPVQAPQLALSPSPTSSSLSQNDYFAALS